MENSLFLIFAQHHKEVKTEIIIKADEKLKNSEYSNVRAGALQNDIIFYESKKVIAKNVDERNSDNEVSDNFFLADISTFNDVDIIITFLVRQIIKLLSTRKKFQSYHQSNKTYFWNCSIILKLKFNNKIENVIECKFPFADKNKVLIYEKLLHILQDIFGLFPKTVNANIVNDKAPHIKNVCWDDIQFLNRKLIAKINNVHYSIYCDDSSIHMEDIKKILFKKSKFGLKINTENKPYTILNLEVLGNVLKFLDIQYKLTNSFLSIPEFTKLLDQIKILQKHVINFFPKDEYINYLVENHSQEYPIIPVIELNNNQDEPGFIFSLKRKGKIYLVWENKTNGRATYIFAATPSHYNTVSQNLYDFIRAELKRKRKGLVDYQKQLTESGIILNFVKKITHFNFNSWRTNILKTFPQ